MALVCCPECGRSEISDSAESCPNCGYAVRRYYEQKRNRELYEERQMIISEQNRIEAEKIESEKEKLKPELNSELSKIDNLPIPSKPTFFNTLFLGSGSGMTYATIVVSIILFLLGFASTLFVVLLSLIIVLWIPFWLFITYGDYKAQLNLYQNKVSDFEAYKNKEKERIIKNYDYYATNMAKYGSRKEPPMSLKTENNRNTLKCPVCGSSDIKSISNLNRTVSVATWGLASSKIGKQYECKKCNHKF